MATFDPITCIPALRYKGQAAVSITKGQALIDNGAGYLTNAAVATNIGIVGVAAETYDNSGGSAGDHDIAYYPAHPHVVFRGVPTTIPATTDIGEQVDLATSSTIDVTASTYQQVRIEDISAGSTAAASTVDFVFIENAYGGKAS